MSRKHNKNILSQEMLSSKFQQAQISDKMRMMAKQHEAQTQHAIRMFIAETAKEIYAGYINGDPNGSALYSLNEDQSQKAAEQAQQKALILAAQLGFIKIQKQDDDQDQNQE